MTPSNYRQYLLGVLLSIGVFRIIDALALSVLLPDIKRDLGLSDTEAGLLTGLAFAFFYGVMGLPIARWADRGNRIHILVLSVLLFAVAIALGGAAQSFLQLAAIRMIVGVGEAGPAPAAFSLIGEYFDRGERARAMSIYQLQGPLGSLVGYLIAGWLNEVVGWRATFVILATPGLVLACLAWFTLRDPRVDRQTLSADGEERLSLRRVIQLLRNSPTYVSAVICVSVIYFFVIGMAQWQPSFLARSFELTSAQVGLCMLAFSLPSGLVGALLGGEFVARFAANKEGLQFKAMAVCMVAGAVMFMTAYVVDSLPLTLTFLGLANLCIIAVGGPVFAIVQSLFPSKMHAVAGTVVYLFANLTGAGLGPVAVGFISDMTHASFGEESLRWSLFAMGPGFLIAALFALRAAGTVHAELGKRTEAEGLEGA